MQSLPSRMSLGAVIMLALMIRWSTVDAQPTPASPSSTSESQRAEASKLTDKAIAAQEAKSYDTAITLYKEAYQLAQHPVLLFNIGQSYRLAGNLVQAELYYRRYLERDPDGLYALMARERIQDASEAPDEESVQRTTMLRYVGYTLIGFGAVLGATGIRSIYQESGYVALTIGSISLGLIGSGVVTYVYAKRQRQRLHQRRAPKSVAWSPAIGTGFAGLALTGTLP